MTPCRAYWTLCGFLLAVDALILLSIANEILGWADRPPSRASITQETRAEMQFFLRSAPDYWLAPIGRN